MPGSRALWSTFRGWKVARQDLTEKEGMWQPLGVHADQTVFIVGREEKRAGLNASSAAQCLGNCSQVTLLL